MTRDLKAEVTMLMRGVLVDAAKMAAEVDPQMLAEKRTDERVARQFAEARERLASEMAFRTTQMREQTAATILAALMHDGYDFMSGPGRANACREAVALADALREALSRERP